MPWTKFFIPFLIFIIAALIRIPNLKNLPDGFFTDEAALGYNAWSIWKTGKDEWNQFLPSTLQSFHDYKPAVYAYLAIPFVAIMGLTEAATRTPAALFGSILPVIVYFWLLSIFNEQKKTKKHALAVASLTALIITFTPWHWEVSRTAIEAGVAICFTMMIFLLLRFQKRWCLVLAIILSLITLNTYHTARLILPILLFFAALLNQVKFKKIVGLWAILIFGLGIFLSFTGSKERFYQISLFNDTQVLALREEAIREDGGIGVTPLWLTRLSHNKPMSLVFAFVDNYLTNTSLGYLFVGGVQPQRTAIPGTGQFLLFLLPFFLCGLIFTISQVKNNNFQRWLLISLLIAPIPASITYPELPHAYRTLFLLVPISIVIAQGIVFTFEFLEQNFIKIKGVPKTILKKWQKPLLVLSKIALVLLLAWNVIQAWHQYARHQQVHQPWHRTSGYLPMVNYLNQITNRENRRIVITDIYMEPYIFILFYNQIAPEKYQALKQKRLSRYELDVKKMIEWQMFEYTFSRKKCPHDPLTNLNLDNIYLVDLGCDIPLGYKRIDSIDFADGVPMFHVDVPDPLYRENLAISQ